MATTTCDVVVLGVGAMGAATCAALARRGVRVVGIERFGLPHDRGSSGGETRLIRKAYFEHPDYVPLLHAAYTGWEALEAATGASLLQRSGCLFFGPSTTELMRGTRASAARHGLALERIEPGEVMRRWPQFSLPDRFEAVLEVDAGYVFCERAVTAFVEVARAYGATIQVRERALRWSKDGAGIRVETDRASYTANHLVVAAGAWSADFVDLDVPLRVTRQPLHWLAPSDLDAFTPERFPCWAMQDDMPDFTGLYYGFPRADGQLHDGVAGIKVGHHADGPPADPETIDRNATPDEVAAADAIVRDHLPTARGPVIASKVCMYTMSPDGHFVLGGHPRHARVTVACGFSGHGFKFAPVVGEALADLATQGTSELPLGLFAPGRFA